MSYDGSELFWKNLFTKEDMMNKIIWNATNEEEFNKPTKKDSNFYIQKLRLTESSGLNVLDFGCGIGRLTKAMAKKCPVHNFAGVDVSQPMTNQARLYCEGIENIQFVHMPTGFTIPCDSLVFDRVFSHIVLQHIHKYKVWFILKEFYRIMKPGGIGCIQLPNLFKCMHDYEQYASDYVNYDGIQISAMHLWTEAEIRFKLEHIGFKVNQVDHLGSDIFITFEKPEVK